MKINTDAPLLLIRREQMFMTVSYEMLSLHWYYK